MKMGPGQNEVSVKNIWHWEVCYSQVAILNPAQSSAARGK